jgi:hypothetical protein
MNVLLDSTLTTSDKDWPLSTPTHRMNAKHLLAVAKLLGKSKTIRCVMSDEAWHSVRRDCGTKQIPALKKIPMMIDPFMPRYDWIKGEWVRRWPFTLEYLNACYEDAVIYDPQRENCGAVLRFTRIMSLSEACR